MGLLRKLSKQMSKSKDVLEYATNKAFLHNSGGKYSVYCVAVDRRGHIVEEAGNVYKSHPVQAMFAKKAGEDYKCFLHAEIHLLIKLYKSGKTCDSVYVARAGSAGNPVMAKPCNTCTLALQIAGITNIIWTEG